MTARDQLFEPFLSGTRWADATLSNLAGDASNRRYLRVLDPQAGPAVLMDAPPEEGEDIRPFVAITELLRARALSAPAIFAQAPEHGLLLLEDLGDDLYSKVTKVWADETELYVAATDLLADSFERDQALKLPDVVISANRQVQARNDSSAANTVFTRDDIDRLQPTSVTDLLSRVPGVQVSQAGGR
ncbi:MAG: phosphotransferase, partial [Pseudomonadota bacterium]